MNGYLRQLLHGARRERGQILMTSAILATTLLGFAALVVDVGFMSAQRRQAQNAADASALAAARVLFQGGTLSSAQSAALEYAEANGYDNVTDNSVEIHIPPTSGNYQSEPNNVEVVIEEQPTSFFIHALLPGVVDVRARGVAGFELFPEPYALVVLDSSDCQAYLQQGGASLSITNGGVMVNSDCAANALRKTGSGDLLVDGSIDVAGGISDSGSGTVSPDPRTVPWTVSDPLASLPPPARTLPPAPGSPGTSTLALVSRCITRNTPTGTRPVSECRRRIRK